MISSISSFNIINIGCFAKPEGRIPDSKIFFLIVPSVADTAAVNPNGIKKLLANVLRTFFIKGKPGFNNSYRNLPRNPPNCPILNS